MSTAVCASSGVRCAPHSRARRSSSPSYHSCSILNFASRDVPVTQSSMGVLGIDLGDGYRELTTSAEADSSSGELAATLHKDIAPPAAARRSPSAGGSPVLRIPYAPRHRRTPRRPQRASARRNAPEVMQPGHRGGNHRTVSGRRLATVAMLCAVSDRRTGGPADRRERRSPWVAVVGTAMKHRVSWAAIGLESEGGQGLCFS